MDDRFDFEKDSQENSFSPISTRDASISDRTSQYHEPRRRPSVIMSFFRILFKLIFLFSIVLTISLCYMVSLDFPDQQRHIQYAKVFLEKFEARRKNLWRAAIEPVSSAMDQAVLGKHLLQKKDAAGAESICKLATEYNPHDIHSWICLGEARLALHNAAWVSGGGLVMDDGTDGDMTNHRNVFALDKLVLARETFEIANSLERGATHAEVRLGLGLSLFLTATRRSGLSRGGEGGGETNPQLLFDAINHLNAAASLTLEIEDATPEVEAMHNAAVYNTALAHLALGDSSASLPLFREVSNAMEKKENKTEGGINVPRVNMGAALMQKGSGKQALSVLGTTGKDYCKGQDEDEIYEYESDKVKNKSWKICSIVQNNLFIVEEMLGGDDKVRFGSSAKAFEKLLGVHSVASKNSDGEEKSSTAEENENVNTESKPAAMMEQTILDELVLPPRVLPPSEKKTTPSSVEDALIALEKAASKDPSQARLWISLSKAKLRSGDRVGAVEAGTKALDVAKSVAEIEASSEILDEALTQNNEYDGQSKSLEPIPLKATKDHNGFGRSVGNDEVASLMLQQEVLNLKLQILQQSLSVSNGYIMSEPPNIPTMNRVPVNNVEKVATKPSPNDRKSDEVRENIPISEEEIEDSNFDNDDDHVAEEISEKDEGEEIQGEIDIVAKKDTSEVPADDEESGEDNIDALHLSETFEPVVSDEAETIETPSSAVEEDMKDDSDGDANTTNEQIEKEIQTNESVQDEEWGEAQGDENGTVKNDDELDKLKKLSPTKDLVTDKSTLPDLVGEHSSIDSDNIPADDIMQEITEKYLEEERKEDLNASDQEGNDQKEGEQDVAQGEEKEQEGNKIEEENDVDEEELILPNLYSAVPTEYDEVPATGLSYMKMADAYMKKDNFKLASKQFLKVLKKSPHHIPAILGYASTFERHANPKQRGEVAKAYSDVIQYALGQNNPVFAQAVLQRALSVSRDMEGDRIDVLKHLASLAFTNELAADIYSELGVELMKQNSTEARKSFTLANGYAAAETEDGSGFHPRSLAMLGEITLSEGKTKLALSYLERALTRDLGDLSAKALFNSASAKELINDPDGAIDDYKRVVSPELQGGEVAAKAHYNLAMIMKVRGASSREIQNHVELALSMGHELTADAVEIMGEHHISVIKSSHRAEWKRYQEALESDQQKGGIMNGPNISNESIFSKTNGSANEDQMGSDTLSMLEQGAAAYDGSVPLPAGEDSEGGTITISSGQQSRAKATAKDTIN